MSEHEYLHVLGKELGLGRKSRLPLVSANTKKNPLTELHLNTITSLLNIKVIEPMEKKLVCGDVGKGAMQNIDYICDIVEHLVEEIRLILLSSN